MRRGIFQWQFQQDLGEEIWARFGNVEDAQKYVCL